MRSPDQGFRCSKVSYRDIPMVNTLIKLKAATTTIANNVEGQLNTQIPDELHGVINEDASKMIVRIEEQLFAFKMEADRRAYLNDVQFHLTELADQLLSLSKDEQTSATIAGLFRKMSERAITVLRHLFDHLVDYLNLEGKLPAGYTSIAHTSAMNRVEKIIKELRSMEINKDLIDLLSAYLVNAGPEQLYPLKTWHQWQYLQETISWLDEFTQHKPAVNAECKLLIQLVARNFNSIRIYAYFLKYIGRITTADKAFQDQQQDLLYLLKVLRQVLVDSRNIYDVHVQPLKDSLIVCLTAELDYVKQREKTFVDHYKSTTNSPSKFYFTVAVTLAEFMFLVKVWMEINFIQTKFKSYIYEFISNHIHTNRAENLSKKSMRNHISNPYLPDRLVINVREWLSKMIAHIDLHYKG
jgi:hypothetical protein